MTGPAEVSSGTAPLTSSCSADARGLARRVDAEVDPDAPPADHNDPTREVEHVVLL